MSETANNSYWGKWIGRLYLGYLRHDPETMSATWRESYCGDAFWSFTLGAHTFGIGWLMAGTEN
jgi:hypothetical protein